MSHAGAIHQHPSFPSPRPPRGAPGVWTGSPHTNSRSDRARNGRARGRGCAAHRHLRGRASPPRGSLLPRFRLFAVFRAASSRGGWPSGGRSRVCTGSREGPHFPSPARRSRPVPKRNATGCIATPRDCGCKETRVNSSADVAPPLPRSELLRPRPLHSPQQWQRRRGPMNRTGGAS